MHGATAHIACARPILQRRGRPYHGVLVKGVGQAVKLHKVLGLHVAVAGTCKERSRGGAVSQERGKGLRCAALRLASSRMARNAPPRILRRM